MSSGGAGQLYPQGRKGQGLSTSIVWHDATTGRSTCMVDDKIKVKDHITVGFWVGVVVM